jgi:hypothetical protein
MTFFGLFDPTGIAEVDRFGAENILYLATYNLERIARTPVACQV